MGAWKDALRRNAEASVISGILLPFMVFLVAFSADLFFSSSLRSLGSVLALGLAAGVATFACLQVGSILRLDRTARETIARQRPHILSLFAGREGPPGSPAGEPTDDSSPPDPAGEPLAGVESALLRWEQEAGRTASAERWIGALVLVAAGALIAAMALVTVFGVEGYAWDVSTVPPGSWMAVDQDSLVFDTILELIGAGAIAWAGALFLNRRGQITGAEEATPANSHVGVALGRVDRTSEELDRSRAMATRSLKAFVLAAVVSVLFLFFPFGPAYPIPLTLSSIFAVGFALALPVAFSAILWTACRLERIASLQLELRRWVRAFARLEQTFWNRY